MLSVNGANSAEASLAQSETEDEKLNLTPCIPQEKWYSLTIGLTPPKMENRSGLRELDQKLLTPLASSNPCCECGSFKHSALLHAADSLYDKMTLVDIKLSPMDTYAQFRYVAPTLSTSPLGSLCNQALAMRPNSSEISQMA